MALPRLNGERQRQRVVARHCQEPYGSPLSEALWRFFCVLPSRLGMVAMRSCLLTPIWRADGPLLSYLNILQEYCDLSLDVGRTPA
jgi:hypothetical protein